MININSPSQLSLLFFGGEIEEIIKEPMLNELGVHQQIKSGKNKGEYKYKNVSKMVRIKGLGLKPLEEWKTKKEGVYQTNEKILQVIAKSDNIDAAKIAEHMLEVRGLEKLIGTYYDGTEKFIYEKDSCVHQQLCHCGYEKDNGVGGGTGTGRLSCKGPNMQNQPG